MTQSPPTPGSGFGIRWVGQEDKEGCGVAALAMVSGMTYAQTKAELPELTPKGISGLDIQAFLWKHGFFTRMIATKKVAGTWPPEPFAWRHIAIVGNPNSGHYVVMDHEGSVFDPMVDVRFRLSHWAVVNQVWGIVGRWGKLDVGDWLYDWAQRQ